METISSTQTTQRIFHDMTDEFLACVQEWMMLTHKSNKDILHLIQSRNVDEISSDTCCVGIFPENIFLYDDEGIIWMSKYDILDSDVYSVVKNMETVTGGSLADGIIFHLTREQANDLSSFKELMDM